MQPSKFFKEAHLKFGNGIEQHIDEIRAELLKVHPENIIVPQPLEFIVTSGVVELPICRIGLEYDILKNAHYNHRQSTKYIILPYQDDESLTEYSDFWIDMACNDYIQKHHYRMENINIISEKHICNVVLPI